MFPLVRALWARGCSVGEGRVGGWLCTGFRGPCFVGKEEAQKHTTARCKVVCIHLHERETSTDPRPCTLHQEATISCNCLSTISTKY